MSQTSLDPNPDAPPGGVFREWVLPILIGLLVGAGIVWVWQHGGDLFRSPAAKIVARWAPGDFEENDRLVEELKKLGKDARGDLLDAFRGIEVPAQPDGQDEWKVWAGQALAGDPFFDKRSLLEIARDESASVWDRRAAAVVLVHALRKDVDPTGVAPVLLGWIEDTGLHDHTIAIAALRQLRADEVFPPDLEPRLLEALLRGVSSKERPMPSDEYEAMRVRTDRERMVRSLERFARVHAEARAAIWAIAEDESDDDTVRVAAIQTAQVAELFDDVEPWRRLGRSPHPVVRQNVADVLFATADPAYDAVLAPMHADAAEYVRTGSIDSQIKRNRPTMLPILGQLVEDSKPFVRFSAMIAAGHFKSHVDGIGARQGMALRLLETSDENDDVEGAILALHMMTGQSFGFTAGHLDLMNRDVDDNAVSAFKSDPEGRKIDCEKWRAHLGGAAVWPDSDRIAALEALLKHADPDNVARAREELAKLKR